MANKKIVSRQKPDAPEIPVEIFAQDVSAIAAGMRKLSSSRIRRDVLEHLVSWKSGVGIVETRKILDHVERLDTLLIKPAPKAQG